MAGNKVKDQCCSKCKFMVGNRCIMPLPTLPLWVEYALDQDMMLGGNKVSDDFGKTCKTFIYKYSRIG